LPKITLMQADEVARGFQRDRWIYEEKYDGWHVVAYKDGTAVRLVSRAGKDHTRRAQNLRQRSVPCRPPR
jgi:ATP-dependent DNA ligase